MWFLRYQRYLLFMGFAILVALLFMQSGERFKSQFEKLGAAQDRETQKLEQWYSVYQKLSGANDAFERIYPIEIKSVDGVLDLYRETGVGDLGARVPIDRLSIQSVTSSDQQKEIGVVDVCLNNHQNGFLLSEQKSAFDELIEVVAQVELDPALSFESLEISAKDSRLLAKLNQFCVTTRAD